MKKPQGITLRNKKRGNGSSKCYTKQNSMQKAFFRKRNPMLNKDETHDE